MKLGPDRNRAVAIALLVIGTLLIFVNSFANELGIWNWGYFPVGAVGGVLIGGGVYYWRKPAGREP